MAKSKQQAGVIGKAAKSAAAARKGASTTKASTAKSNRKMPSAKVGAVVRKAVPGTKSAATAGRKVAAAALKKTAATVVKKAAVATGSKASVKKSAASASARTAAAGGESARRKPSAPRGSKLLPVLDVAVTMQDGRYALPASVHIELPRGYKPSAREEYMGPQHLQYFRNKLSKWREDLVEESRQTIESLRDEVRDVGDDAERATRETENSLELRTRDRYRKLIAKIDKALKRIEEGHYGFCEETDEEIGIDRLEARPIATLSLDAQERREHRQKQMGD